MILDFVKKDEYNELFCVVIDFWIETSREKKNKKIANF